MVTPFQGLRENRWRMSWAAARGLATAQAFTWRAFSPYTHSVGCKIGFGNAFWVLNPGRRTAALAGLACGTPLACKRSKLQVHGASGSVNLVASNYGPEARLTGGPEVCPTLRPGRLRKNQEC